MPTNFVGWLKLVGLVAATFVATVAAINAFPQTYWLAHRGYVVDQVTLAQKQINDTFATIIPTVNDLSHGRLESQIEAVDSEAANWTIKMAAEPDTQTKNMMQSRINDLAQRKGSLQARLRTLPPAP